jgi:lactate dehydrogenase-like 2-hydroxyacid dehydrogenase
MQHKLKYLNNWLIEDASQLINEIGASSSLEEAHALVGFGMKVDGKLLDRCPQLKVVALTSVGYDNCDVPELTKRGVLLTNTPDILTETTADLAFSLIMTVGRRVVELMDLMREKHWTGPVGDELFATDIFGKKLGIIGFGRIGQAIGRRGKLGFNMDVSYYSRHEVHGHGYEAQWKTMDEVLRESDYVCVAAPLTPETKGLIGERELGLMKKEAFFVNIARGPIVDESALIKALQNNSIRGAGLDVFEREPLHVNSQLLRLKNVVVTPHVGSATNETRLKMLQMAFRNAKQALSGETPDQLVNKELAKK